MRTSHVAWLAGSGRSGTTWLSGLLATAPRTAQVFEPLHPRRAPIPPELDPPILPGGRPYLRPDAPNPGWGAFVDAVCTGTAANRWTRFGHHRRTRWPHLWWKGRLAHVRLVKEIRSNLMAGWLAATGRARVALVLRHPCATVLSQEEGGWGTDLRPLLDDPNLREDWLGPHISWLERLDGARERMAARWAIENAVPLRQAENGIPIRTVHYEDVVSDAMRFTRSLGDHLGLRPAPDAIESTSKRRIGSREGSGGGDPLSRWQQRFDSGEAERILDVCRRLGMTCYDEGPLPVTRLTADRS